MTEAERDTKRRSNEGQKGRNGQEREMQTDRRSDRDRYRQTKREGVGWG